MGQLEHVLVVSKNHELTQYEHPISKIELQNYRTIIVHDSAKQAVPWSSNIIEQSQHFYVATVQQKIQAIIAGIGIGFLPICRIEQQLSAGDLVAIELDNSNDSTEIFMAWKLINKGKGLKRLREIVEKNTL